MCEAGVVLILALLAATDTWGGEKAAGGLPPSIAKERPSASLPADLPGSRASGCDLGQSVTIYRRVTPRTALAVDRWPAGAAACQEPSPAPKAPWLVNHRLSIAPPAPSDAR
jgi:hypothetical protein